MELTLNEMLSEIAPEGEDYLEKELSKYCHPSELEDFVSFIYENQWEPYDSIENWIKGRRVETTKTLYKIFKGQIK